MTDTGKVVGTLVTATILSAFTATIFGLVTHAVGWMLLLGTGFGLLYGLEAGLLRAYDLASQMGVLELIIDLTWAFPSTVVGFVFGNLFYLCFGNPSRAQSENEGWISFKARGTSGFGVNVLQTVGTVNLGGAGNHEKVHLLQHRIFGLFYVPFVVANYIVTGAIQILFTITIGAILKATGKRDTPYLRPPAHSAVQGFFGWIYYATIIELWAYGTEP